VLTGTVLSATSTTSSQTTDPNTTNNTASANPNATTSADLGVTSSLAPNPRVVAGQTLTDTVTVTNGGPSAAAAPVVTMTIPASTTFQGLTAPGDWTCTKPNVGGTGTVLCTPNSGRLAAGASAQFVLTLGVTASVPNNSSIGVTTTTDSQTNDPNQINNASTATVTVAISADLAVSDAASSPVVAGQDVTYTTTLVNNGPSDAPNVVVTATVPAGTTFGSFTASGWTCGVPNASGVVTCTAATLPAGHTVSFLLVVHVNANVPAGVTLTSDTGAADAFDPDMSNNTASADARVGSVADLAVTLAAAPSPVVAGQNVTYTAALTNTGPSDAAGAVFTATIPASTTVQSVTAPANWTCVPPTPGSSGVVSCQPNGGSLAAGAHATIAFQLAVSPSAPLDATLDSTATVSSASGDPTPANNSATARAAVTTLADLAMSETASPDPVIAGQDVTYTATLTNTGPSDAASSVVTLTVPTNTTFVSLAAPTGWTCGAPDAGGVVTCTDPTLAAGQRVSFPLVVHVSPSVTDGATLTSATGASTTTTDPNLSNNAASAGARVVTRADLRVTGTVAPSAALPGQTVTYRAAFTNVGPSDAQGVVFTETVPRGASFVAVTAPDGWTCTPPAAGAGVVSCTAATVAAGATGTVAVSVRVNPDTLAEVLLEAASTISSATVDPDASNNSSTTGVTVLQTPPTATAAPANTATGTAVPTGTAMNTAAPANTATSTAAPAATSSPTTPADTATAPATPPTHTPLSTTDVSLAPSSTTRYVGIPDTLTVSVTRDGAPAPSLPVTCRVVSGPDAGLVMPVMTDAHGQASCSFTSRTVGTDTVVASVTDVTVAHASNLVRVQWMPAGPPCSVQVDLLTGPVLTRNPAYHGRLIDGALGRGHCAAVAPLAAPRSAGQARTQARSAAPSPSACTQGWAAVSSYDYTITDPTGAVMRTPRLAGHVLPGDTIQASFTIKPRPARCATVRVSLASYAAPSLANDARALSQQALYQSATGLFGAGAHNLALRVDVPARRLAIPSPVRPHIAGVRVRGTLVFHHRARRSAHARSSHPTKGHRRGA